MVFKDTPDRDKHRFLKNDRIVFNNAYTPEMNQETINLKNPKVLRDITRLSKYN